jgi:hypothetical protein
MPVSGTKCEYSRDFPNLIDGGHLKSSADFLRRKILYALE